MKPAHKGRGYQLNHGVQASFGRLPINEELPSSICADSQKEHSPERLTGYEFDHCPNNASSDGCNP